SQSQVHPPYVLATAHRPSALNQREWPLPILNFRGEDGAALPARSHTRTRPVFSRVTSSRPSGLNAAEVLPTAALCRSGPATTSAVSTAHTRTVPSAPIVTRRSPWGLKVPSAVPWVFSKGGVTGCPVITSQTCAGLSDDPGASPETARLRSGLSQARPDRRIG